MKGDLSMALDAIRHVFRFQLLNTALSPKKQDAALVKDFQPISLVHSFAKLETRRPWSIDWPLSYPIRSAQTRVPSLGEGESMIILRLSNRW